LSLNLQLSNFYFLINSESFNWISYCFSY